VSAICRNKQCCGATLDGKVPAKNDPAAIKPQQRRNPAAKDRRDLGPIAEQVAPSPRKAGAGGAVEGNMIAQVAAPILVPSADFAVTAPPLGIAMVSRIAEPWGTQSVFATLDWLSTSLPGVMAVAGAAAAILLFGFIAIISGRPSRREGAALLFLCSIPFASVVIVSGIQAAIAIAQ
jgi:hypothetical protein